MQLDRQFLSHVLSDFDFIYGNACTSMKFSVDTRTLQQGDMFVALKGENTDGHNFIAQAFAKGASGCIISTKKKSVLQKIDKEILSNKCVISVQDTFKALCAIATQWRKLFDCPVVAITGSVGKTTTKEFISRILTTNNVPHLISKANQNTIIGVILTIMQLQKEHKAFVQEVGISKRNEMKKIIEILQPTTAIITNIGHQHMDGLGSLQDIAIEKRNVFSLFSEKNIGIINGDDPLLTNVSYGHPVVRFGLKTTNQVQARKVRISGESINCVLKIYKNKYNLCLPQSHEGVLMNVLAATAATHLLGIPDGAIVKAVQQKVVVPGRFEKRLIVGSKGILINDTYNANPESMKAALQSFQSIKVNGPKIAIIGDMLGLGVNAPFWHRQIGRFLRKVPSLTMVIFVGDLVTWTKKTSPSTIETNLVENWKQAALLLEKKLTDDSVILIKGSRAMGLENLVQKFSSSI